MAIRLRPVASDNSGRLFDWRNRPEVAAYMYTDHLISPEEHARWFRAAMAASDRQYWVIELDAEPVGLVNLAGMNLASRRCEWAYYLAEPNVRGRGVGAAVELTMLDHVFDGLKLNKLWCEVLIENESVWRLHESFGFVREAHFREHVWKGGRFQDVIGLGLLARDWAKARPACAGRLVEKGYAPSDMVLETAA